MVGGQRRLDTIALPDQRVYLKPPGFQVLEKRPVGANRLVADLAPGIGEHTQGTRRRDRRIELAQTAGRGIARIGEYLIARRLLPFVERGEFRFGHVNLTAHLDRVRRLGG